MSICGDFYSRFWIFMKSWEIFNFWLLDHPIKMANQYFKAWTLNIFTLGQKKDNFHGWPKDLQTKLSCLKLCLVHTVCLADSKYVFSVSILLLNFKMRDAPYLMFSRLEHLNFSLSDRKTIIFNDGPRTFNQD